MVQSSHSLFLFSHLSEYDVSVCKLAANNQNLQYIETALAKRDD
jgi:hypothetical protein